VEPSGIDTDDARRLVSHGQSLTAQSPHKKRSRDDDLLRPLGAEVKDVPTSFEFNEVRDPEVSPVSTLDSSSKL
jgi:hypothetical protein